MNYVDDDGLLVGCCGRGSYDAQLQQSNVYVIDRDDPSSKYPMTRKSHRSIPGSTGENEAETLFLPFHPLNTFEL